MTEVKKKTKGERTKEKTKKKKIMEVKKIVGIEDLG